jgi:hypothetical protein
MLSSLKMPQPEPYSQIDSADLAGTPVLSLLAERGLEFRRVPFRIRQVFWLFLTLFALASVVSVLLMSALENSPPPTSSMFVYVICGAVALIASVWILISNHNVRVIATNDGITVRSTSVKWSQIAGVRRGWLFHSSVFVHKASPIEISNWIQGGDFVLDLCEWAKDHKLELADGAAVVTAIDKVFRARGCWFEYLKFSWGPPVGQTILSIFAASWYAYAILPSGDLMAIFFGGWFAVYFALRAALYAYLLLAILRARKDRVVIELFGVRQHRRGIELAAIAWADVTSSKEHGPRLQFPVQHKRTKASVTSFGMGHAALMNAVLEYGHATGEREK